MIKGAGIGARLNKFVAWRWNVVSCAECDSDVEWLNSLTPHQARAQRTDIIDRICRRYRKLRSQWRRTFVGIGLRLPVARWFIRRAIARVVDEAIRSAACDSAFARVVLVNLDRRPDRQRAFYRQLGKLRWPLKFPERVPAIDGEKNTPPSWWTAKPGAWGCYSTHLKIIEECIERKIDSVLILEDDAVFAPDFARRLGRVLVEVPDDWECLYLGGEHLLPPSPVNKTIVRPQGTIRTHAWALRGAGLEKAAKHLRRINEAATSRSQYIDHWLSLLHARGDLKTYAAKRWLVGQSAGRSDISRLSFGKARFWSNANPSAARVAGRLCNALARGAFWAVMMPFLFIAFVLDALGVEWGKDDPPRRRHRHTGYRRAYNRVHARPPAIQFASLESNP